MVSRGSSFDYFVGIEDYCALFHYCYKPFSPSRAESLTLYGR